jgi:prefoldin subunit 5
MIAKYQFMEANVAKRAAGLREKLPEMEGTLSTVRFLRRKREQADEKASDEGEDLLEEGTKAKGDLSTTFSLNDTLFAHALITPTAIDEVYLWLGANVMVAYPLVEAEEMLAGRAEKAKQTLGACEEDLEFLRVQITTVEVATARVYNWDVVEKRRLKESGVEGDEGKEER